MKLGSELLRVRKVRSAETENVAGFQVLRYRMTM